MFFKCYVLAGKVIANWLSKKMDFKVCLLINHELFVPSFHFHWWKNLDLNINCEKRLSYKYQTAECQDPITWLLFCITGIIITIKEMNEYAHY